MIRTIFAVLAAATILAGCVAPGPGRRPAAAPHDRFTQEEAARRFIPVIDRVEPVAEATCRRLAPRSSCGYTIFIDPDPAQPPNAAQTLDQSGNPVIIFNLSLLREARNEDELAFILGHEAAHHIQGHIARARDQAITGALVFGALAASSGAGREAIDQASQIGASLGARRFSKDHELEADALGARIAWMAGYDPLRGAEYFFRSPDPGNQFLGSHPPNEARIATVRREVELIRSGR